MDPMAIEQQEMVVYFRGASLALTAKPTLEVGCRGAGAGGKSLGGQSPLSSDAAQNVFRALSMPNPVDYGHRASLEASVIWVLSWMVWRRSVLLHEYTRSGKLMNGPKAPPTADRHDGRGSDHSNVIVESSRRLNWPPASSCAGLERKCL
ncbi:hypothetical protein PM082_011235 [Marasmius tenuissimus]|nr:hypothetical protein PM082_011235 [Marasmius tenuissimus]